MEAFIKIKDDEIHYTYEPNPNNLPIVLFVHGYNDSSKTITPLTVIKNRNYVVYAIDLPGCGLSSALHKPITLEYYCLVLEEFIKQVFGDKHINLLSHSMGSIPCLYAYKTDQIDNFIMLTPLNYSLVHDANDLNKNIRQWLLPKSYEEAYDGVIHLVYEPNEVFKAHATFLANKLFVRKDIIKENFNYLVNNEILNNTFLDKHIKPLFIESKPFTLVYAQNDNYVTTKQINHIKPDLPQVNFVELERCGHAAIFQKSHEINNLINKLIK